MLEGAFHFCQGTEIRLEDLPELTATVGRTLGEGKQPEDHSLTLDPGKAASLREAVESFEKDFILRQARECISQAELAERLHISRQTLHKKLRKYRLTV